MAVHIVILAGGVGGSRFVRGARAAYPDATITVIVNTADDITLHGLRICPDLDTMMYALGGSIDPVRGWGRAEESWRVKDELAGYGVEPSWFGLGDLDLATHLVRTQMLDGGYRLSEVTEALCTRWLPVHPTGTAKIRLLPMSDDRVETHIVVADPDQPSGRRAMHFQEYWVRFHAEPDPLEVLCVGVDHATPGPGVLAALISADAVLIAPSNPVVSIGPILAVPGIRAALRSGPAPVVGFSGILSGAPVLGMADRLLPAIGVQVDAAAVGRHYGARAAGGLLDAWLVDSGDQAAVPALIADGLPTVHTDLLMDSPEHTGRFIALGLKAARSVASSAEDGTR